MRRALAASLPVVSLLTIFVFAGSQTQAAAAVFRDRAAFEAAAQNLRTMDFESAPQPSSGALPYEVDGIRFVSIGGLHVGPDFGSGTSKRLFALTVGEITRMTISLPPGTTAVGLEQFARPMIVSASSGESVTMTQGDGSNFVGFVGDTPITELIVTLDSPEPTPSAAIDDLTFGQRRAGNEPPKPLLLTFSNTGRAAAFDSVALTAEPFSVHTPRERNLAADGATRVTLLVVGVPLEAPGEEAHVTARAVLAGHRVFDLAVEGVGRAKNLSWLGQVTVRLPAELAGAGEVTVTVTVRGVESNGVPLSVD